MAVNAVKPAGIRAASFNSLSPAKASSRCSSWVSGFVQKPALKAAALSRIGRVSNSKLFEKKWQSARHVQRPGGLRALHSDSFPLDLDSFSLDSDTFEGEDFRAAQRAYTEHANIVRYFPPCELSAEFEAQKVLRLAHEPFRGGEESRGLVPLWQKAQGVLAAAVLTMVMLINVPQPSKPAIRETAPTRRSVGPKDSTARRGQPKEQVRRRQPREQVWQEEAGSSGFILPAVLSCTVIAMLAQLLRKKATVETSTPEPEPKVTVFNLHVGVLGTATSLRMDLDEIEEEKDISHLSHISRMSRTGMRKALSGTARVLMKNLEHIAYASNTAIHRPSSSGWEHIIANWQSQEETGFHARTGKTVEVLRSVALEYGRKVPERLIVDSLKAGYTVISLKCAIKGQMQLPPVKDTLDLHVLLARLEKVETEDIMVMNLKWTPKKGESLPEETMLQLYPSLKLLAAKEDLEDFGVLASSEAVMVDA